MRMWKIEIKTLFSGRVLSFFVRSFSADRRKKKKTKIPLKNWTRKHFVPNSIAWLWLLNSLDNGLIMILQSTMQPGHIISAWRYLVDDRTNHARQRDLVNSSSRWISSMIFLTSLNGIGSSSSLPCTPSLATHTCEGSTTFGFIFSEQSSNDSNSIIGREKNKNELQYLKNCKNANRFYSGHALSYTSTKS